MIRIVHGTLPTCDKMYNKLKTEQETNRLKNKNNHFFQDKYKKHNNGICPCFRCLMSYHCLHHQQL